MRIGGLDVAIKVIPEDTMDNFGSYSMSESLIRVYSQLPKHTRLETILHEVIECIVHTNEIPLEHKDLTTLSMNLYQVLRDNGGNISKWK